MKVSIIIPVYNVEPYITGCLESVARQTYQGDMECLIVDDCGTDRSIPMAQEFIRNYQGNIDFKILHHNHNRGLSAARNTGMEAATGDYVYFLDSDDAIIPETIELMTDVVARHPQVEMVQGGIASMKGKSTDDFTKRQLPEYSDDIDWMMENMLFHLPVSSWNRLLKRDFLIKEGVTFHEGIIHEDVPYCYLLALKCCNIGFVNQNTYLFRPQREGSITSTPQAENALRSRIVIMHDCIEAYSANLFSNKKQQHTALKALWRKWATYMVIHDVKVLSALSSELSRIQTQLTRITPWPHKMMAFFYGLLPIKLQHKGRIAKMIS